MKNLLFVLYFSLINLIITEDADPMNYICDNIYLGDSVAAGNEEYLKQYNISVVVNCADVTSSYKNIKFLELSLYDIESQNIFPKFEVAYNFIKRNSKNNTYILIHCMVGMSRSASLVVFYLMKEKGWDYDTCITYMRERRPGVSPNNGFERQLREYYDNHINKYRIYFN